MKYIYFLIIALSLFDICYSQEPVDGWDSFKRRIIYPAICQRAGVEDQVSITLRADTSGTFSYIDSYSKGMDRSVRYKIVDTLDQKKYLLVSNSNPNRDPELNFFEKSVIDAIQKTQWIYDKKPNIFLNRIVDVIIEFKLSSLDYHYFLIDSLFRSQLGSHN